MGKLPLSPLSMYYKTITASGELQRYTLTGKIGPLTR
jgi:hypothetical protein